MFDAVSNSTSISISMGPAVATGSDIFEFTKEGFLVAYRYELLREHGWRGDSEPMSKILRNARITLTSNLRLWNHESTAAQRAYRAIGGQQERLTLHLLRALPSGDGMKTFEIVLNQNHLKANKGFTLWLKSHKHEVDEVMRYGKPSLVNGKAVRIGHPVKSERTYEERVIDQLYRLYRLSILMPSEEGVQ